MKRETSLRSNGVTIFLPFTEIELEERGVREMSLAFVFINAEIGSEDEVLKQLRKMENVKEAYMVYGVYDIVAKVEAETMEKLKEALTRKVRKVDKIRSTLTMMVIEET